MDKSSAHAPRRIQLFSTVPLEMSKKAETSAPSVRLNIKLTESTDSSCPEYSYIELLGKLKHDSAENTNDNDRSIPNAFDPFAVEDGKEIERMEKIAQSFNNKYGPSKKNKRKRQIRDHVDLGEGYLEDSFVDNSEAYDELVPWSLDTKYGGFYINSGTLNFVKGDGESDDDEEEEEKDDFNNKYTKFKDEDDGDDKEDEDNGGDVMPVRKKKKMLVSSDNEDIEKVVVNEDGTAKKKKRKRLDKSKVSFDITSKPCINGKLATNDVVTSPQDHILLSEQPNKIKSYDSQPMTNNTMNNNGCHNSSDLNNLTNDLIKEINEVLSVAREALTKATTTTLTAPLTPSSAIRTSSPSSTTSTTSTISNNQHIISLTQPVLEMLSRLYSLCASKTTEERSKIFSQLSGIIGVSKEALYKKIRKYRIGVNNDKLNEARKKLEKAVSERMEPLLNRYKELMGESQKLKSEQKEMMKESHHMSGDDDDADDDNDNITSNKFEGDKLKRITTPRKKFSWTPELRKMLCDTVELRLVHYDMSRIKSQTAEEYLKVYLESEVKSLWPPGWMQTRVLFKESKLSHHKWTGVVSLATNTTKLKPKKVSISSTSTKVHNQPDEKPSQTSAQHAEPIVINLDESNDNVVAEQLNNPIKDTQISLASTTSIVTDTTTTSTVMSTTKHASKDNFIPPSSTCETTASLHQPLQEAQHQSVKQHQIQQQSDQPHQKTNAEPSLSQPADQPLKQSPELKMGSSNLIHQQKLQPNNFQKIFQQPPQQHKSPTLQNDSFTFLKDKPKTAVDSNNRPTTNFSIDSLNNNSTKLQPSSSAQQSDISVPKVMSTPTNKALETNGNKLQCETFEYNSPKFEKQDVIKQYAVKPLDSLKPQQLWHHQYSVDGLTQKPSQLIESTSKWTSHSHQHQPPHHQDNQQHNLQTQQNIKLSSHNQQDIVKPSQPIRRITDPTVDKMQSSPSNYKANMSWSSMPYQHNTHANAQNQDVVRLPPQQQQLILQQRYQQYQQQQQEKQQQILNKSPKQGSNRNLTATTSTPKRVSTTTINNNFTDDLPNTKILTQQQQQFLSQSAQQRQLQQHIKHQHSIDSLEVVDKIVQGKNQIMQPAKQHSKSHSVEVNLADGNVASRNHISSYKMDNKAIPTTCGDNLLGNKINCNVRINNAFSSSQQTNSATILNNPPHKPLYQQLNQNYNTHPNVISSYQPHPTNN